MVVAAILISNILHLYEILYPRFLAKSRREIEVTNPFDGSVVDTVPKASTQDVDAALTSAVEGAAVMAATTGYERFRILRRAAELIRERSDDLARTLSSEGGKAPR